MDTLPETNSKMVGRWNSFWEALLSGGDMLVSGICQTNRIPQRKLVVAFFTMKSFWSWSPSRKGHRKKGWWFSAQGGIPEKHTQNDSGFSKSIGSCVQILQILTFEHKHSGKNSTCLGHHSNKKSKQKQRSKSDVTPAGLRLAAMVFFLAANPVTIQDDSCLWFCRHFGKDMLICCFLRRYLGGGLPNVRVPAESYLKVGETKSATTWYLQSVLSECSFFCR